MQNAIQEIINSIPSESYFDSHFIIEQLIKFHSDAYLTYASSVGGNEKSTESIHGQIGKEIAKFEQTVITRLPNKSWSSNIRGNASNCTAWVKN